MEIFSPSEIMHNGVAGGNSKREEDSRPADVPQGAEISQTKASVMVILIVLELDLTTARRNTWPRCV